MYILLRKVSRLDLCIRIKLILFGLHVLVLIFTVSQYKICDFNDSCGTRRFVGPKKKILKTAEKKFG
jgi:hypothetical protein